MRNIDKDQLRAELHSIKEKCLKQYLFAWHKQSSLIFRANYADWCHKQEAKVLEILQNFNIAAENIDMMQIQPVVWLKTRNRSIPLSDFYLRPKKVLQRKIYKN